MEPLVVGERKRSLSTPPETIQRQRENTWKRKERLSERKIEQEDGLWRS
jgi:hypothetical protein